MLGMMCKSPHSLVVSVKKEDITISILLLCDEDVERRSGDKK